MEVKYKSNSPYVSISSPVNKAAILPRQENHFKGLEELSIKVRISEGKVVFNQEDHIIIGSQTVSWYMSRVGEFYFKSNDDFDAKHIGKDNIFRLAEIEVWLAVAKEELCYLEVQLKGGDVHQSIMLDQSEFAALNELQQQLNKSSRIFLENKS